MNIGQVIHFHNERFFEGAVQLNWLQRRVDQAKQAAEAFVFHGPRYHSAGSAESDGVEGAYRLKDTASFVRDLLGSMIDGVEGKKVNPYWLVVAGYGSGKSHLALTCATLLSEPTGDTSQIIINQITRAAPEIGEIVRQQIAKLSKPSLVLPLDGMAGFHLGNALSKTVFQQLSYHGVDADAIRDLSPRFHTAENFVKLNYEVRTDSFIEHLPSINVEQILMLLRENDEEVYAAVDAIYHEANGTPIPIEGQESAQELIDTLCNVYCGPNGPFSHVIILFDELGRYLEYASEKPQLAGDFALQQIFQGVQDNSNKVRFIGFIQYELKAYLKRFSGADLRQLQRYVTRFDTADKWYLSTNLETIFAHMIGKNEDALQQLWKQTDANEQALRTWQRLSSRLPGFSRFPVWSDPESFNQNIAKGCWPLHPFAVWFLTRQRDLVQSRSALTFIKEVIDRISNDMPHNDGRLRQVSAAELVVGSMLPELLSAERETGGTVAETLQTLLEKFSGHLDTLQQTVLAGVAVIEKTRIGKQDRDTADALLSEATAIEIASLSGIVQTLSELGAVEWNNDLGQYELLSDGATRGQFQQWLRSKQADFNADGIRDLFIRRGAADIDLGNIPTDFHQEKEISTPDWYFEAQLSHVSTIEKAIHNAVQEWKQATLPKEAKGKIIYLYIHQDEDLVSVGEQVHSYMDAELKKIEHKKAPIWVIGISDKKGVIADHIVRMYLFDEKISSSDLERFKRFVTDERERSRIALKENVQNAIKERNYWIPGISEVPIGRLRTVGLEIFRDVYPKAVPYPFDGFASASGGGPADSIQLTRGLIARSVDGTWVQSQTKRLQNRVNAVLSQSWKALLPSGKLSPPSSALVSELYKWLELAHKNDPHRTLLSSYHALIAPPYGFNASSASVLIGLLLGVDSPPRRVEMSGELVPSTEWLQMVFPSKKGQHFLNEEVLSKSRLIFLSVDSIERWRTFLNNWEGAQNYVSKIELARKAKKMVVDDPLPESLEGTYKYLCDGTDKAEEALLDMGQKIAHFESENKNPRRKRTGYSLCQNLK